jgi:hypothetical protein
VAIPLIHLMICHGQLFLTIPADRFLPASPTMKLRPHRRRIASIFFPYAVYLQSPDCTLAVKKDFVRLWSAFP